MKNSTIFYALILTFIFALTSIATEARSATNPFLSPKQENLEKHTGTSPFSSSSKISAPKENAGGMYTLVMTKVSLLQKQIRAKLTGFARDIKRNPGGKSLWMFMGFAFLYGIVHAVGPGHGKSVVCAYFISRGGTMFAASFMSWLITLIHVGSAAVTVCLAYLFLKNGMSGFEAFNHNLQTASFALVTAIGLWLLFDALRSFRTAEKKERCTAKQSSLKEIATVAFFTGIVPCPGAAIILVYTLSTGILWAGLAAMIFLATGMAVTTSGFAFAAAKARNTMDRISVSNRLNAAYSILSVLGASVITAFGAIMLGAHLS